MTVYNDWLDARYTRSFHAIRRPKAYSVEYLQRISQQVGMEYHLDVSDEVDLSNLRPLEGLIHICELEEGVSLSASDIASKQDGEHSGDLPRSVAVILHLGGAEIDVNFSNGLRLHLTAGQACLVSLCAQTVMSNETHNGERGRTVLLHCRPEQMQNRELRYHIDKLTAKNAIVSVNLLSATWQKAHRVFGDTNCDLTRDLLCKSLAQEILVQVVAFAQTEANEATFVPQRDVDRLSEVKLEIDQNPQGDHTLGRLAQTAGTSISSLKRKFTDLYGIPVGAYLRLVRMEEAKVALETGQMSIAQAAHIAGYQHAGNFSSAFRKCYGILPSDLRSR